MSSKKFNSEQLQRCVDILDSLAQSGLSTQAFAQTQGLSYFQVRAWQSHAPRWRAILADESCALPARPSQSLGNGFIQVNLAAEQKSIANVQPSAPTQCASNVRIDCSQGARSVVLHWPTDAPLQCAQWLKAYLA